MDSSFKSSFLQFDITPNVSPSNPAFLQGMAGGLRRSTAVAVPLSLEMCLLEDINFTKLLFVTADIIGFDKTIIEAVRAHVAPWGIGPEGIVMNASHTHYAPGTLSNMSEIMGPYYENYAQQILNLILSSLQNLYDRLEPCKIYSGLSEARIGVNRRIVQNNRVTFAPNPDGAYLTHTPVVKIELLSSKKRILWVSHGCHPTGMGFDTRISSDYPGLMKYALKKDCVADGIMFFQGAGGTSKEAVQIDGRWKFCDSIGEVHQNGLKLAACVKESLDKALQPVHGKFYCSSKRINLPTKASRDHRIEWEGEQETAERLPFEVQMVCLGERIKMLTFPAEPAAELADRIKKLDGIASGDLLLGYTNGLEGYLPTDSMLDEGGYEVEQSHLVYRKPAALARGSENLVIESVTDLLQGKKAQFDSIGYAHSPKAKGSRKAFFVLSSGRCGTMTLAYLLDTATNARVWHHPKPDPIREALLAWWGKIDQASTFWRVRRQVIHNSWAQGLIHGETDLLMTPFAKVIAEEIPDSKFIVLVRNPWDFVRSGMRRNYYKEHPWDIGRLRPDEGTKFYNSWQTLDQFDKICWLWRESYSRIRGFMDFLGDKRVMTVRFEDLIDKSGEIDKIFQFLDLDSLDMTRISSIKSRKLNAQRIGDFPKYDEWSSEMKRKLWDVCADVAKNYGYAYPSPVTTNHLAEKTELIQGTQRRKKIVFITGMYNSGILLLSKTLNRCGLKLAKPDIVGSQANEEEGWRNCELSLAARRLFGAVDRWYNPVVTDDTDDVLEGMGKALLKYHRLFDFWGWNDPQTVVTFEYWKNLIPRDTIFNIVVCIRNPYEVAQFLKERNGFSIKGGIRLWERYNSHVVNYIEKGYPVYLFNFNAPDKCSEMNRICEQLGLESDASQLDNMFDEQLVHYKTRQIPGNPIYRRLMASWERQAGVKAEEGRSIDRTIRPPLGLAILIVNGRHNYKDRLWVEKAIGNVIRHTSVYRDYRIFVWNHDYKNQAVKKYLSSVAQYVEVLDEATFDIHSFISPKYAFAENNILNYHGFHIHRTPLQILYDYANQNYEVDTFFTMDSDSWPIKPNWDIHILAALGDGAKLVGVWRDEMASAIEPFVHASGLGIKAETIVETGLRFDRKPDGPHEDTLSHFTRVVQQRYGESAIRPLKRSNRNQYHAVYGGLYGDLIYHHHQGTIYQGGNQKSLLFKGSADRGERAEDNKRICDALTEMVFYNYDDYMNEMLYGEAYKQMKLQFYLFKNRYDKERLRYMLQLANVELERQPLKSYFLLNLVIRPYAFSPSVLSMMANACSRLRLYSEAKQYELLALQFSQELEK